jgi:hypothetical protein
MLILPQASVTIDTDHKLSSPGSVNKSRATRKLTHARQKFALTDRQLFAFSTAEITVFFSRAFLSFSTSRPIGNWRWTRFLAYTGTVNTFPRDNGGCRLARVTEIVDKFSATARIPKVFPR